MPILDSIGAAGRTVMAARGEHVVACIGTSVRHFNEDTPIGQQHLDGAVVAVARSRSRSAALDHHGVLHLFDDGGAVVASRPIGDAPRSLWATEDNRFVALVESGVVICDEAGGVVSQAAFAKPLVAAADPSGSIVIVGEDNRLAEWTGSELVDIPPSAEQIAAIASLGGGRFACVGQRHWFLLDLAQREMESIAHESESVFVAASPNRQRIAWYGQKRTVFVGALEKNKLVDKQRITYPKTYGNLRDVLGLFRTVEPNEHPLEVTGLAFLDDAVLAIALDCGLGNLIDLSIPFEGTIEELGESAGTATRKLDEQEGDTHRSWTFHYQGKQLMAM